MNASIEQAQAQQCQCWICPHCFDDAYHYSDAHGCERHGDPQHEHRVPIGPTDV